MKRKLCCFLLLSIMFIVSLPFGFVGVAYASAGCDALNANPNIPNVFSPYSVGPYLFTAGDVIEVTGAQTTGAGGLTELSLRVNGVIITTADPTLTTTYTIPSTGSYTIEIVATTVGSTTPAIAAAGTLTCTAAPPPVPGSVDEPLAPVPGCDVQLAIPATAVVGSFLDNTTAHWQPGSMTSPPVVIQIGQSAWTLGVDASGQYRQIIWSCSILWVPIGSMGPNYDKVWNGRPLPMNVVG